MILSALLLVPLLGLLCIWKFPKRAKDIALASTLVLAGLSVLSMLLFRLRLDGYQFSERFVLFSISDVDIAYHLGVDGISYPMILLTVLLSVVAVLVSRREIADKQPTYYCLLLGLLAAVLGVFMSLHLVLFFVFWEAVLVLMFLLILRWGGSNRKYAAMKFLVYTGIGSAGLFLAIILLGVSAGSLDLALLNPSLLSSTMQYTIFCALLFAFFVKMPIVPFHTWLPDAHVQAPTAGSIVLAGVLLKMGAYGLLRIGVGVLHDVSLVFRTFLFIMGTITIVYGAFLCLTQRNLKRLIAYSSVNHMGFVLLGIAAGSALGITGAVFEMVSHGLLASLLFALAGLVHQRTGTFDIDELHGLAQAMPKTAWLLVIAALGSMGLPSMTGFIAEFLVLYATFLSFGLIAIVPVSAVVLTGAYTVRLLSRVVFGKGNVRASEGGVSMLPFGILVAAIFLLGLLPFIIIGVIASSVFT